MTVVFYTSVHELHRFATQSTMLQSKQSIHEDGSEEGVDDLYTELKKGGK
jgi:hypothetical protein